MFRSRREFVCMKFVDKDSTQNSAVCPLRESGDILFSMDSRIRGNDTSEVFKSRANRRPLHAKPRRLLKLITQLQHAKVRIVFAHNL